MTSGDQQQWAKRLNQHTGAKAYWKSPTLKLYVRPPVVSLNFSTEKFTVTGFDRPKDTPMDSNIYCMRPNLELYAVLSRIQWIRLRRQGKLDKYLSERRNNAVLVSVSRALKRLTERHLLYQSGAGWSLTEHGLEVANTTTPAAQS